MSADDVIWQTSCVNEPPTGDQILKDGSKTPEVDINASLKDASYCATYDVLWDAIATHIPRN